MAKTPRYKRVLVKLSGESFCTGTGPGEFGIEARALQATVGEIAAMRKLGVETAIVVGGGNLLRGRQLADNPHIQRTTADAMGMLATVINGLALQDALEDAGIPARAMSAIPMPSVCEPFTRRRAVADLAAGRVVVLTGGTGSPFFTTDTCASLRACELQAGAVLKATKVDGVFDSDPEKNPSAKRYERLTYREVIERRLAVMDLTAISMCMDNKLPIVVFQMSRPGNLLRAVCGENVGTVIA